MTNRPSQIARNTLILLCDIVGYSNQKQEWQANAVSLLWQAGFSDPALGGNKRKQNKTRFLGAGDGFYFVDESPDDDSCVTYYKAARRLIDTMRKAKIGLRVGLHLGHTESVQGLPKGKHILAGTGLNEAARIVSYADAGQVVMTEDFVSTWQEAEQIQTFDEFDRVMVPARGNNAFPLLVKHGHRLLVRFDSFPSGEKVQSSQRMQQYGIVVRMIKDELLQLAGRIQRLLSETDNAKGEKVQGSVHPRLSIFQPIADGRGGSELLLSTIFRQCTDPGVAVTIGHAHYSLDSGLGQAYAKCEPVYIAWLPDPTVSIELYQAAVSKAWNTTTTNVKAWQRSPRSLFALPLNLMDNDHTPTAAVCVDIENPLYELEDEDLQRCAYEIHRMVMGRLAFLWRLLE